jgi:hypothetical protein
VLEVPAVEHAQLGRVAAVVALDDDPARVVLLPESRDEDGTSTRPPSVPSSKNHRSIRRPAPPLSIVDSAPGIRYSSPVSAKRVSFRCTWVTRSAFSR